MGANGSRTASLFLLPQARAEFLAKGLIDPIMPLNDDVKSVRRQLPRLRTSFPLKEENVLKTPNQMHPMAARRTT